MKKKLNLYLTLAGMAAVVILSGVMIVVKINEGSVKGSMEIAEDNGEVIVEASPKQIVVSSGPKTVKLHTNLALASVVKETVRVDMQGYEEPLEITSVDSDLRGELVVSFESGQVIDRLGENLKGNVVFILSGQKTDGSIFYGQDSVKIK